MLYIGIDISKNKLNTAFLKEGVWQQEEISNKTQSIQKWIKGLGDEAIHLVFEATGSYGAKLLYLLNLHGKRFTLINPSQSQGFARVKNNQNQTDARDAVLLAEYGAQIKPEPSLVAGEKWEKLRQTRRALRQLKKYERMIGNQLHALAQFPFQDATVKDALDEMLHTTQKQIKLLETSLCDLTGDEMNQMIGKLTTINGIGPVTARELIIATNGFEHFENAKQVAKFIGISPATKSSGTSVRKKGKISRSGDSSIRGTLYMAAISAKGCNKACEEIYKRLKDKGKSTKEALVAVAHKLIRQAFAVAKSMKDFDNNYYLKFQRT